MEQVIGVMIVALLSCRVMIVTLSSNDVNKNGRHTSDSQKSEAVLEAQWVNFRLNPLIKDPQIMLEVRLCHQFVL